MALLFARSLFVTGSDGPSFLLQSLCAEEEFPLHFDNAPEVLYAVPSDLVRVVLAPILLTLRGTGVHRA